MPGESRGSPEDPEDARGFPGDPEDARGFPGDPEDARGVPRIPRGSGVRPADRVETPRPGRRLLPSSWRGSTTKMACRRRLPGTCRGILVR
eukprot:gene9058-biopygen4632